jgi:hypothetical protein
MLIAARVLTGIAGLLLIRAALASAVRTVILPRGIPSSLGRVVFVITRRLFRLRAGGADAPFQRRDRVMAAYGPVSLLVLLVIWVLMVMGGYVALYWAVAERSLREAYSISGSSIVTLGFDRPADLGSETLSFTESALGLVLLALLITYLPSLYSSFARRESEVTALEVRASSPPSGVEMIKRFTRLHRLELLHDVWVRWERWFVELEESHTSFSVLVFFRSPQPDHSWITAAGAVLDAAALANAVVDTPHDVDADICIRAGYVALRRIASFFGMSYNPNPDLGVPITISRDEFDAACADMEAQGVPLKSDRDKAWDEFRGWRVNYDKVLLTLCGFTMAPYAPWSSDRAVMDYVPPLLRTLIRPRRGVLEHK